jgi:flavin reductase (DIM6/NTAB) family NADH-FMN oxidoreductase RutF
MSTSTERSVVPYTEHYDLVMEAMTRHGLLLGSYDAAGKPNVMTIGWGSIGSIWGVPIWTVLVRPSRYTYRGIEHSGCFSVNVPGEDLGYACAVCGSRSGRDIDKFDEAELVHEKGSAVLAPVVGQCPVVYECQVVHSSDVLPEKLADEIMSGAYRDGDFHRIYFGKILSTRAAADAAERLKG